VPKCKKLPDDENMLPKVLTEPSIVDFQAAAIS
jgi:hypothetical protein